MSFTDQSTIPWQIETARRIDNTAETIFKELGITWGPLEVNPATLQHGQSRMSEFKHMRLEEGGVLGYFWAIANGKRVIVEAECSSPRSGGRFVFFTFAGVTIDKDEINESHIAEARKRLEDLALYA
jgi:hypothetical protein